MVFSSGIFFLFLPVLLIAYYKSLSGIRRERTDGIRFKNV